MRVVYIPWMSIRFFLCMRSVYLKAWNRVQIWTEMGSLLSKRRPVKSALLVAKLLVDERWVNYNFLFNWFGPFKRSLNCLAAQTCPGKDFLWYFFYCKLLFYLQTVRILKITFNFYNCNERFTFFVEWFRWRVWLSSGKARKTESCRFGW